MLKHLESDQDGYQQQAVGRRQDVVPHDAETVFESAIEKMYGRWFDDVEKAENDKGQQLRPPPCRRQPQDQPEGYYFVPDHAAMVRPPHLGARALAKIGRASCRETVTSRLM